MLFTPPFEAILQHQDGMGLPLAGAHQPSAGLGLGQPGLGEIALLRHGLLEPGKPPLDHWAETAEPIGLQFSGDRQAQKIPTDHRRWGGAIEPPPEIPKVVNAALRQGIEPGFEGSSIRGLDHHGSTLHRIEPVGLAAVLLIEADGKTALA